MPYQMHQSMLTLCDCMVTKCFWIWNLLTGSINLVKSLIQYQVTVILLI